MYRGRIFGFNCRMISIARAPWTLDQSEPSRYGSIPGNGDGMIHPNSHPQEEFPAVEVKEQQPLERELAGGEDHRPEGAGEPGSSAEEEFGHHAEGDDPRGHVDGDRVDADHDEEERPGAEPEDIDHSVEEA